MRIKTKRCIDEKFMWIRTQYKKTYPVRNYYAFGGYEFDDIGARNIK